MAASYATSVPLVQHDLRNNKDRDDPVQRNLRCGATRSGNRHGATSRQGFRRRYRTGAARTGINAKGSHSRRSMSLGLTVPNLLSLPSLLSKH